MTSTVAGISGWQDLTHLLPATTGWMHSGIAVEEGTILVAHPEGHALVRLGAGGEQTIVPLELTELHTIRLTSQPDVLAVADPGHRFIAAEAGRPYGDEFEPGRAALIDGRTGDILLELEMPAIAAYAEQAWRPTSIAVDDTDGGTGDIWVADGYGQSLVHRFDAEGAYLATFDASSTGTALDCPHGILLRRAGGLEVVIADRTNHRIVVIDQDGSVARVFGADHLDSPSSLTTIGDDLYVTELFGGVAHFTIDGAFVETLEPQRRRSHDEPGWPNTIAADGSTRPPALVDGQFNSPHGIASYAGDLYLTEWFIGGRLIRIVVGAADDAT